jgi:hypothetical protein
VLSSSRSNTRFSPAVCSLATGLGFQDISIGFKPTVFEGMLTQVRYRSAPVALGAIAVPDLSCIVPPTHDGRRRAGPAEEPRVLRLLDKGG